LNLRFLTLKDFADKLLARISGLFNIAGFVGGSPRLGRSWNWFENYPQPSIKATSSDTAKK